MFTSMQKMGRMARVFGLLSLVAVLGGLLFSAAPASAARSGAGPQGGGILTVYVNHATTHTTIVHATVVVQDMFSNNQIKGLTDGAGYYKVNLPAGSYTVEVLADGFETQKAQVGVKVGATSRLAFMLQPNNSVVTPPPPAFMVPKSTLYVRAIDGHTGSTVANATVSVRNTDGKEVVKGATDSAGEFKVDLPQGEYVVVLESPIYQSYKVAVFLNSDPVTYVDVKLQSAGVGDLPPTNN